MLIADLVALAYLLVYGPPSLLGEPPAHLVGFWAAAGKSLALLPLRATEVISLFGWLDTPVPSPVLTLWVVALACLVVNAVQRGAGRALVASGLVLVVCVLVPTLVEAHSYDAMGLYVQGRYVLPLLAGIPLLLLTSGGPHRSLLPVVLGCLAVADLLSYQQELRRYTVGLHGPLFPAHTSWEPELPWPVLAGSYLALVFVVIKGGLRPAERFA